MTRYTCAVADCKSTSKTVKRRKWARFPPAKREPLRRKLWEQRCRREEGWKATRNNAICSLHFIGWDKTKPARDNPDPVKFKYNGWGKNCLTIIKRKRNKLQCQRQEESAKESNIADTNLTPASTHNEASAEQVFLLDNTESWPEVKACTTGPEVEACTSRHEAAATLTRNEVQPTSYSDVAIKDEVEIKEEDIGNFNCEADSFFVESISHGCAAPQVTDPPVKTTNVNFFKQHDFVSQSPHEKLSTEEEDIAFWKSLFETLPMKMRAVNKELAECFSIELLLLVKKYVALTESI